MVGHNYTRVIQLRRKLSEQLCAEKQTVNYLAGTKLIQSGFLQTQLYPASNTIEVIRDLIVSWKLIYNLFEVIRD